MAQMYQVEIPSGVQPGDEFQVSIAGSLMVITCPPGVGAGSVIQATPPLPLRSPPARAASACL